MTNKRRIVVINNCISYYKQRLATDNYTKSLGICEVIKKISEDYNINLHFFIDLFDTIRLHIANQRQNTTLPDGGYLITAYAVTLGFNSLDELRLNILTDYLKQLENEIV